MLTALISILIQSPKEHIEASELDGDIETIVELQLEGEGVTQIQEPSFICEALETEEGCNPQSDWSFTDDPDAQWFTFGNDCALLKITATYYAVNSQSTLFRYWIQLDWCTDFEHSTITSVSDSRGYSLIHPDWRFVEHVRHARTGGPGQQFAGYESMGHFDLCIPYWVMTLCGNDRFPKIGVKVFGNGLGTAYTE